MSDFLKKLQTGNFRLRFLKLSEINSWNALENYTRIKSFILDGNFEIACDKWYKMYLKIIESLQATHPIDLSFLLNLEPMVGRCKPFVDCSRQGYLKTNFGLYIRDAGPASKIVMAIKWLLKLYGFDWSNAYLVVELTPDCTNNDSDEIIENEKNDLKDYLQKTFVEADRYYDIAIRAIDEMNHSLQYFSSTTYNNLYLLSSYDFDKYSNDAIERQMARPNNEFTRSELTHSVYFLRTSRFTNRDYLNIKSLSSGESFIVDGDKRIQVMFKTYFMEEKDYE